MLYNDLLDSDQFHNSEVTRVGLSVEGTLLQTAEWKRPGEEQAPTYGGASFSALTGVNFVILDREAAAKRNIRYIRENIANRIAYENSVKENISAL